MEGNLADAKEGPLNLVAGTLGVVKCMFITRDASFVNSMKDLLRHL